MSAQKVEHVRVEGQVVKVDRVAGEFPDRTTGEVVVYDFHESRILTGDYEVVVVRFPKAGPVPLPNKGDQVHYKCDARNAQGNVKLTVESQEDYTFAELLAAHTA